MRQELGFVAFVVAFLVPGLALLYALGFVTRVREVPGALGPAFLAGVAGTMTVLLALLSAGAAVRMPLFVVVVGIATVGLVAAGFVLARRRPRPPGEPEPERAARGLEVWVPRLMVGVMAAFFLIGFSAFLDLPTVGDDWTIWSYKGLSLYQLGGTLDHELYTRSDLGPAHPYYPMLQPLLQSLFFRTTGEAQLQEFHAVLWVLFGSFIWTVLWLARTRSLPLWLVVVPTAALAFGMKSHEAATNGYADTTVSSFAGAGALAVGLWLRDGAARYAVLGGVLLAGGANTKNEGVSAAIVVLLVAAAFVVAERGRGWRPWLAAAGITLAGTIPWSLWRSAHDVTDASRVGVIESFERLPDELHRVPKAFTAIFDNMADSGAWTYLVPCLLALAVVCLVRGVARREAAFYLSASVLMTLALVFTYTTGLLPVDYWLESSANRTVSTIVYVCGVGTVHLVGLLLRDLASRPQRVPP